MAGLERRWPRNPLSRRYLMLDLDYGRTQDVERPAGSCLACRRAGRVPRARRGVDAHAVGPRHVDAVERGRQVHAEPRAPGEVPQDLLAGGLDAHHHRAGDLGDEDGRRPLHGGRGRAGRRKEEGSACGGVCACSTCHVYVSKGFDSLSEMSDDENDILDKAFDVRPTSRLGCQAKLADEDVEVKSRASEPTHPPAAIVPQGAGGAPRRETAVVIEDDPAPVVVSRAPTESLGDGVQVASKGPAKFSLADMEALRKAIELRRGGDQAPAATPKPADGTRSSGLIAIEVVIGTVLGKRTVRRREWELALSWSNWTIGTWWGKLGQRHLIGVELGPLVLVGTRRPTHGRRHRPRQGPRRRPGPRDRRRCPSGGGAADRRRCRPPRYATPRRRGAGSRARQRYRARSTFDPLKRTPSRSRRERCVRKPGASRPLAFTTRWQGTVGSLQWCMASPTNRAARV